MGGSIILRKVSFTDPTQLFQYVSVKIRLAYTPDQDSSYQLVNDQVPVAGNGVLVKPLTITGLKTNTKYILSIANKCGDTPVQVEVSTGTEKIPVISWQGADPTCEIQEVLSCNGGYTLDGNMCYKIQGDVRLRQDPVKSQLNTGKLVYASRIKLVDGVPDGTKVVNVSSDAGYIAPVEDFLSCPLPTITWVGEDAYCEQVPDTERKEAKPPTASRGIVGKVQSSYWATYGTFIYEDGFPLSGNGTVVAHLTIPHFWVNGDEEIYSSINGIRSNEMDGRFNASGIWAQGDWKAGDVYTPVDEWIGFTRTVSVQQDKQMYIGISGDNLIKIRVNGTELLNTEKGGPGSVGFTAWSIYPVALKAGQNVIEMSVKNASDVASVNGNPGGFGAEIYDMTLSQLVMANSPADLNIIFSTRDMVGEGFDIGTSIGYSCESDEYMLESIEGHYYCTRQIMSNTGKQLFHKRRKLIDGKQDIWVENVQDEGYIPGIINEAQCPVPTV